MKKIVLAVALTVTLCSCTSKVNLLNWVKEPAPLESIAVSETIGFGTTQLNCMRVAGPGFYGGCAYVVTDCVDTPSNCKGVPVRCDIWLAFDWDYLRAHELHHCQGYGH